MDRKMPIIDRHHLTSALTGMLFGVLASAATLIYFEGGRDAIQASIARRLDSLEQVGTAKEQKVDQVVSEHSQRIAAMEAQISAGKLADQNFQTTQDATRDRLKIIFDLHEKHSAEEARLGALLGRVEGKVDVLQSGVAHRRAD